MNGSKRSWNYLEEKKKKKHIYALRLKQNPFENDDYLIFAPFTPDCHLPTQSRIILISSIQLIY